MKDAISTLYKGIGVPGEQSEKLADYISDIDAVLKCDARVDEKRELITLLADCIVGTLELATVEILPEFGRFRDVLIGLIVDTAMSEAKLEVPV